MIDVLAVAPDRPETSLRDGGSHLCHVVHQHLNGRYKFLRACAYKAHVVEVLVVAPAHDHILDAASLLVDAQLRVVPVLAVLWLYKNMMLSPPGVVGVWVVLETLLAKDNGRLRLATHRESISHHRPLRLTVERHDLP